MNETTDVDYCRARGKLSLKMRMIRRSRTTTACCGRGMLCMESMPAVVYRIKDRLRDYEYNPPGTNGFGTFG